MKFKTNLPGSAAVFLVLTVAMLSAFIQFSSTGQVMAQQTQPAAQPSPRPVQQPVIRAKKQIPAQVPDQGSVFRLVLSSLVALNQANNTGNYSVFHMLGAPGFRKANPPQRLAKLFAKLRNQNVDLTESLLIVPVLTQPTAINNNGFLHVKGNFPLRPRQINFEFLFQSVNGNWLIFGIAVNPSAAPPLDKSAPSATTKPDMAATPAAASSSGIFQRAATASGLSPAILAGIFGLLLFLVLGLIWYFVIYARKKRAREERSAYVAPEQPRMPPPAQTY